MKSNENTSLGALVKRGQEQKATFQYKEILGF
jgi:hypothetical protein